MTLPTEDIPWEDITAWLAGRLSAAEVERLQEWIAEDPARDEFVRSVRLVWDSAAEARPSWDARLALDVIKARGGRPKVLPLPALAAPSRGLARWRRTGLVAAAAAAVVIAAGGWWIVTSSVGGGTPRAAAPPALQRYETARGQRLAFKLPDGSGVMLGPESSIQYARSYGERDRVVELEGDASFEVAHDAARPFEVRTAYAVARDLGTRFVVRARRAAPAVEVAVAEGEVALGSRRPRPSTAVPHAREVVLGRGDWGQVLATGALTSQRGVALDHYFGWTEGRLYFEAADLADVVVELNRWYDVDIRLADSAVGRLRLTATFRDQPITEVLASIQASLRLELSGVGRHFTLASP